MGGTLCQTPNCKPQSPLAAPLLTGKRWQHTDGKTEVNDIHHIQHLNSVDGMSWKAGHNEFFNGMTFDDARVVLGTALNPEQVHPFLQESPDDSSIPTDFDARTQWPGLIHPIRNQMRCGSCWDYLTTTGIVTDSCFPYGAGNGTAPTCPSRCQNSDPFFRFKARNSYAISGVGNMQK